MFRSIRNLSTRMTVAFLIYLAVTGLLLTGTLHSMLDRLARAQMNQLGNALSAQLSETLKQPVIDKDIISTQVILDNLLAESPAIARATVYSTSNRIIAQSQRPVTGAVAPYINPVSVDDNMLAQLRLELDEDELVSEYRFPIWIAFAAWFLLSIALAWYGLRLARDYSRRIERINHCFAGGAGDGHSELAALEAAVAPFLGHRGDGGETTPASFAMLAVSIPNLPKWQAQLNAEHFAAMLGRIDALLDNHLSLFDGRRLHNRDTATLLEFNDRGGEDPLCRAINCANALLQLTHDLVVAENMPFELRITAAFRRVAFRPSPWFNALAREACVDRLLDILPLAGAWELIVDKADVEASRQLNGCDLEDFSAASVWQFTGYTGERRETFSRQADFLSAVQN